MNPRGNLAFSKGLSPRSLCVSFLSLTMSVCKGLNRAMGDTEIQGRGKRGARLPAQSEAHLLVSWLFVLFPPSPPSWVVAQP